MMQTKPDCITAQDPDVDQSFSHQYVAPVELGELVNFEHRNLLDEMEEEEEEEDYDYNEAEVKVCSHPQPPSLSYQLARASSGG